MTASEAGSGVLASRTTTFRPEAGRKMTVAAAALLSAPCEFVAVYMKVVQTDPVGGNGVTAEQLPLAGAVSAKEPSISNP